MKLQGLSIWHLPVLEVIPQTMEKGNTETNITECAALLKQLTKKNRLSKPMQDKDRAGNAARAAAEVATPQ